MELLDPGGSFCDSEDIPGFLLVGIVELEFLSDVFFVHLEVAFPSV